MDQVRDLMASGASPDEDSASDRKRLLRAAIQMGLLSKKSAKPQIGLTESVEGRVAATLVALGADLAGQVIQDFSAPDAQKITSILASIKAVPRDDMIIALTEFKSAVENTVPFDVKKLLAGALGGTPESLGELTYRQKKTQKIPFYDVLCDMQTQTLARYIGAEHPQFAAAILALLPPELAGKVIGLFSSKQRSETIRRISSLKSIDDEMLRHINDWVTEIVNQHFVDAKGVDDAEIGGVDPVVDIISSLSGKLESKALEEIKEIDPNLSKQIDQKMIYFEDLPNLANEDIARLIREIPRQTLAISLKGSTEKVIESFYSNMSERQKTQIDFEVKSLPPLRVSEIEEKQKEVVKIARALEKQKLIVIAKSES